MQQIVAYNFKDGRQIQRVTQRVFKERAVFYMHAMQVRIHQDGQQLCCSKVLRVHWLLRVLPGRRRTGDADLFDVIIERPAPNGRH